MSEKLSIEQQSLLVYVAMQNLQYDRSALQLSDELGISRFKVGRMIDQARELGLVEVVPKISPLIDLDLSRKLKAAFGLEEAIVVIPATGSDRHAREAIAIAAAKHLVDYVREGSLLGVGPGRTIIELCNRVNVFPKCDIVQLTGIATKAPADSIQSIFKLSTLSQGSMHPLHAPLLATSEEAAKAIISQPIVQEALLRIGKVDASVLTIGGLPRASLLADTLSEAGELAALLAKGAVAEMGTTVITGDGEILRDLDSRTIGITTEQLRHVPYRVGLGGGESKRQAVLATLRAGLMDMIVTDAQSARMALE
jgi:DNA-binding transcriptional regulator LsrR (DeoR family)